MTDDFHGGSDSGKPGKRPKRARPAPAAAPRPVVGAVVRPAAAPRPVIGAVVRPAEQPARKSWLSSPLVTIGLLAIIALAVGISIYVYYRTQRSPTTFHYRCLSCGAEFTRSLDELQGVPERIAPDGGSRLDCPKCKAQGSAVGLVPCPNCSTYFVPAGVTQGTTQGSVPPPDICPKCGTDVQKFYAKPGVPGAG